MYKKRVHKPKQSSRFFVCALLLLVICVVGISVYLLVSRDVSNLKGDSENKSGTSFNGHAAETLVPDSVTSSIGSTSVDDNTAIIDFSPYGTGKDWSSLTVEEKLNILKVCFPSGKYWNHRNMNAPGDTFLCVSGTPCSHSQNGYVFCNQYQGTMRNLFPDFSGIQCFGYASLLSDLLFGTDAPISEHQDIERIRVGDHIRFLYAEHSVIVTEVGRDENGMLYIFVTECNSDYENCCISWGRRITQDELTNIWICTRYPD